MMLLYPPCIAVIVLYHTFNSEREVYMRPLTLNFRRVFRISRRRASHTPNPQLALSLKSFLLRQRVLHLYRTILRSCQHLPSPSDYEMRTFAREEFERQRGVKEEAKIRYLISTGEADLKRLGGAGP